MSSDDWSPCSMRTGRNLPPCFTGMDGLGLSVSRAHLIGPLQSLHGVEGYLPTPGAREGGFCREGVANRLMYFEEVMTFIHNRSVSSTLQVRRVPYFGFFFSGR